MISPDLLKNTLLFRGMNDDEIKTALGTLRGSTKNTAKIKPCSMPAKPRNPSGSSCPAV